MKDPKVLFFDVETSPVLAYIFRVNKKQYISHEQIKKGMKSDIICVCWKWNYENIVHSEDWGLKRQDSNNLVKIFGREAEKADLILAHNATRFDIKHINTQRLLHGQDPIAWPSVEDTLLQFKKYFYLPSYKLDYISTLLEGEGKNIMVLQDWIDIIEYKSKTTLNKMINYCKKDVILLEKIYNKAKSFFKPKTNMSLVIENGRYGCPRCGSDKIKKYGIRRTLARSYQRVKCNVCGTVFDGTTL